MERIPFFTFESHKIALLCGMLWHPGGRKPCVQIYVSLYPLLLMLFSILPQFEMVGAPQAGSCA